MVGLSPPHHEQPLGEERILIIDYTPVQARGKGEALSTNFERG
jgi:hypothetical protein